MHLASWIHSPEAALNADVNVWLGFTILFFLRVVLPGAAWSWIIPRLPIESEGCWVGRVMEAGRIALMGAVLAALSTLLLAEAGLYTKVLEWSVAAALVLAGWVVGKRAGAPEWRRQIPAFAFFGVAAAVLMCLPGRGEWVVGGWDPGTYVTRGVDISRTGTFRPTPDPTFSLFTPDELPLFTRPMHNYVEAFPVIPLDPDTRAFHFLFFRLTPSLIAVMDRLGGLRAATRVNEFAGLLALAVFAAAMLAMLPRRADAWFAVLALLVQPIWLYHLHIPTSEMLQLLLVSGMGLLLPVRRAAPGPRILLPLLLFAAVVNRFAFLPFGGILLGVFAVLDLDEADRRAVARDRVAQIAALAAGAGYDFTLSSVTVGRVYFAVPALVAGFACMAAAVIAIDSLARWPARCAALVRWSERWALPVLAAGTALILAVAFVARPGPLAEFRSNVRNVTWYIGAPSLIAAAAGLIVLALRRDAGWRWPKAWTAFLLVSTLVLLMSSRITTLWPWAARRFVDSTVPLLALLAGAALGGLWRVGGRGSRIAAAAAAVALAVTMAPRGWQAWTCTEFNGATAALAQIAERIGPEDIVVADHFRWGTPLRFIYGKRVLNGEVLYDDARPGQMRRALAVLDRLRADGYRIRFLTSTPDRLAVFPETVEPVTLDWTAPPFVLRDIAHSRGERGFRMRERPKEFNLFTWK